MNRIVLFVSHKKAQCGVYEFGKSTSDVLQRSRRYHVVRAECSSFDELNDAIARHGPDAIVYNYMPTVFPWIATRITRRLFKNNIADINIPQIGIVHDITQGVADSATAYRNRYCVGEARLINSLFDFYIAPDPTLLLRNPLVYKTGRLIPSYQNNVPLPRIPTIGSFGFGTPKKGFENIVRLVQEQFDEAVIRLNIPSADFGDKDGVRATAIAANCKSMVNKPGIQLVVTHEYMDNRQILNFLAENSINVFLYEDTGNRGLSSALDIALAVQRPVGISSAVMFRHLFDVDPSIRVDTNNLATIMRNGFDPLRPHCNEWNAENLLWEYERIFNSIFAKLAERSNVKQGIVGTLRFNWNRLLSRPAKSFSWLDSTNEVETNDLGPTDFSGYQPIQISSGLFFNRILDNSARKLYKPAVDKLTELVPKTMRKKISGANIQQAFVFDTVYRHLSSRPDLKVLCVGSHEDTASMSLRRMGFRIEEIDPTLNYFLQEFFTKPTTIKNSYDIVFATSVIEHDPDDESFVECVAGLLAPGGIGILTCDYMEDWKPGVPIPAGNARFYTQHDLKDRLLPIMKNCELVDEPHWTCPNPDFEYLGIYRYTFASVVVRKIG